MRSTLMAGVALLTSAAACATPVPPAAATVTAQHSFGPEISAEDFSAHVRTLAGDDFAGRSPGGIGETKTVEYLIAQLQRLGLHRDRLGRRDLGEQRYEHRGVEALEVEPVLAEAWRLQQALE